MEDGQRKQAGGRFNLGKRWGFVVLEMEKRRHNNIFRN